MSPWAEPVSDTLQQHSMLLAREVEECVERDDAVEGAGVKALLHDIPMKDRRLRHSASCPLNLNQGDVDPDDGSVLDQRGHNRNAATAAYVEDPSAWGQRLDEECKFRTRIVCPCFVVR
jgi:hypothetical protein